MKQLQDRTSTTAPRQRPSQAAARATTAAPAARPMTQLPLWRINLLRVGYLVMGGGLAVYKWPLFFDHEPWSLAEGTVQCLLVAMSVLALLGLRYPLRMLPILLFEVGWKALWLGVVALPLWVDGHLEGAFLTQTNAVLVGVVVVAVIPWRYAFTQFVLATGDPWRRR
jgi:hypothetical protein